MELNWSLTYGPIMANIFYEYFSLIKVRKKSSKIANWLDSYIFHDFQKSIHSFCMRVSDSSPMQTFLEIKNAECKLKVYYH